MKQKSLFALVPISLVMISFCSPAKANELDVEIALFKKKVGLCEASIKAKNCTNTQYCQDLNSYTDYIFKDSVKTYFDYNIAEGNFNDVNIKIFTSTMNRYAEIKRLSHLNGQGLYGSVNCYD